MVKQDHPKNAREIKMAIKIQKSDNPEYKDTIRVSAMQPFEYIIMSKDEYMEPLEGESKYNPGEKWNKYNVMVHEYKTMDPNTGEVSVQTPNEVFGYFASGKTLVPKLVDIEVGQKFKVTQEQVEGKSYKMYKVELVNDDGTLTLIKVKKSSNTESKAPSNASEPAPSMTLDDELKTLKASGILNDTLIQALSTKFDVSVDFVKTRAEAL